MSAFGEAWRKARASGSETFEFRGKLYNTRKKGESSKQWKAKLAKQTIEKGKRDNAPPVPRARPAAPGSPLPRARPKAPGPLEDPVAVVATNDTPAPASDIASITSEADAEAPITEIMVKLYEQVLDRYAKGMVSKEAYDNVVATYDKMHDLRYGEPEERPAQPGNAAPSDSSHPDANANPAAVAPNPRDEMFVPQAAAVEPLVGGPQELRMEKAGLMSAMAQAYTRGDITPDQANYLFGRIDNINESFRSD